MPVNLPLSLSMFSPGTATSILRANLINYWKLENTNWVDSHTNADTLTAINSPTAVAGQVGNAAEFGATKALRKTSYTRLDGKAQVTWMFFIKVTTATAWVAPASQYDGNTTASDWSIDLRASGLKLNLVVVDGSDWNRQIVTDSDVLTLNTIHHVRVQYDGAQGTNLDRAKFWVGGTEITAKTATGTLPATIKGTTVKPLEIGSSDNALYSVVGWIDEMGIWGANLTTAQADAHRLATDLPY